MLEASPFDVMAGSLIASLLVPHTSNNLCSTSDLLHNECENGQLISITSLLINLFHSRAMSSCRKVVHV